MAAGLPGRGLSVRTILDPLPFTAFLDVLFRTVAAWRGTLVSGVLMHAAFDVLAVFARKQS